MMVATALIVVRFYCAIRKKCFILNEVYTVTAAEFFLDFYSNEILYKGIVVVIFFIQNQIIVLFASVQ